MTSNISTARPLSQRIQRVMRWMILAVAALTLSLIVMMYYTAQPTQPFDINLQPGLLRADVEAVLGSPAASTTTDDATVTVYQDGEYELTLRFVSKTSGAQETQRLVSWSESGPYKVRFESNESNCNNCPPKSAK